MSRALRALRVLLALCAAARPASPRLLTVHGWDLQLHHNPAIRTPHYGHCLFYKGNVLNHNNSNVMLTECEGNLYGLVQINGEDFILQPKPEEHLLRRRDVTVAEHMDVFNLTGDTADGLDLDFNFEDEEPPPPPPPPTPHIVGPRNKHTTDRDYFRDITPVTRTASGVQDLWLEMAVIVDHSMVKFHGRHKIKHYVLALMNIVSAIFNDPSLGASLTLVINKLFMYEEPTAIIKRGNYTKSLEAVNRWNYRHLRKLPEGSAGWDAAVWLTRELLGGPSGYAAVGGVCSRNRSATVNRDEGLTSAFVIAHELAHTLGLVHDGSNQCGHEPRHGSVMAPTVPATLHQFAWSSCSRRMFHEKARHWHCLHQRGGDDGVELGGASELPKFVFSMDEQCRMQFGDGFTICKSLRQKSPCSLLRCAHRSTPRVCLFKAPPLEGTPCKKNHWCVGRVCEPMPGHSDDDDAAPSPPSPPEWDEWGEWSHCDAECGYGLKTRSRECKYNGLSSVGSCEGASSQAAVCFAGYPCAGFRDARADACRRQDERYIPYIHREGEEKNKCESWCIHYAGGEPRAFSSLPDGTACSYDKPYDICHQGVCVQGQCNASDPVCNWCPDGYCSNNTHHYTRQISRGWKRLSVIPHGATQLSLHISTVYPLSIAIREKRRDRPLLKLSQLSKEFTIKADDYLKYDTQQPENLRIVEVNNNVIELKEERVGREGAVAAAGTVLEWRQTSSDVYLSGRSQLQTDLMILATLENYQSVPEEHVTVQVSVNFSTPSSRSTPREYNKAPTPEYGTCSASCGGGVRAVRTRCPRGSRCQPTRFERCNTQPCEFSWSAGEWEGCSATCGEGGVQERQLFCVPANITISTHRSRVVHSVSPALCPAEKPDKVQSCNQIPCPVYWQEMPWTPCSATCGRGFSVRPLTCAASSPVLCGPKPKERRRRCRRRRCPPAPRPPPPPCAAADASQYCELFTTQQLMRNCRIPRFKEYCCIACRDVDGA